MLDYLRIDKYSIKIKGKVNHSALYSIYKKYIIRLLLLLPQV
jgi:hypothetical protein